jgi:hypothetical protein
MARRQRLHLAGQLEYSASQLAGEGALAAVLAVALVAAASHPQVSRPEEQPVCSASRAEEEVVVGPPAAEPEAGSQAHPKLWPRLRGHNPSGSPSCLPLLAHQCLAVHQHPHLFWT